MKVKSTSVLTFWFFRLVLFTYRVNKNHYIKLGVQLNVKVSFLNFTFLHYPVDKYVDGFKKKMRRTKV